MNSTIYPKTTTKKNATVPLAKVVVLLMITLGLLWFSMDFPFYRVFAPESAAWKLWVSYAKDLLQPFAFYFFLCLGERWLKTWQVRALIALAIPTILEFGQLFYYQISTVPHYVGAFDPWDLVMYAVSVGLAVWIDQKVFANTFKFWHL